MMSKTIALRTLLNAKLSEIATTYYSVAKDNHPNDYIVFSVTELSTMDEVISAQFEINVMGYGKATDRTEELADTVQRAFDHQTLENDDIFVIAYQSSRNVIQEEDKNIIRRRIVIDARIYERK